MPRLEALRKRIFKAIDHDQKWLARLLAFMYTNLAPGEANSWIARGVVHSTFRSVRSAEIVVREGLQRCPWSPRLWKSLSSYLLDQKKYRDAEEALNEGLSHLPNEPLLIIGLADLHMRQRHWPEAKKHAEIALHRLTSSNASHHELLSLASVLVHIPGERESAIALLRQAVSKESTNPTAHLLLYVLLENVDEDEARRHLLMGKKLWRSSSEALADFLDGMRKGVLDKQN